MPRNKTQPLKVGDRVQYSAEFCRNTGQCTGATPFARGTIIELQNLGECVGNRVCYAMLATITWDNPDDLPDTVNVKNLERSRRRRTPTGDPR